MTKTNSTNQLLDTNKLPGGLLTAALTPLNDKLDIDYDHLVNHIKWLGNRAWLNIRPPNVTLTAEVGLVIEQRLKELDYFNRF